MDLEYFNQSVDSKRIKPKADYLKDIERLCDFFGHPELDIPCIHVAGSKGKGSITTMAGNILKAAGFETVGLYRSPALTHFTDRVSEVDGPFPEEIYKKALKKLQTGVEKLLAEKKIAKPTYYEIVTLFAFLVFKEAGCDFAVYEVGMGGRLDATNIVHPEVAVINTIELEHTKILGDTLEKIAAEKAGIIKNGVPVVIGPQPTQSVKDVFIEAAKENKVVFVSENLHTEYFLDNNDHLKMHVKELDTDLNLPGDFQGTNALVAATAVRLAVPSVSNQDIKAGLERTFLPGRFEMLTGGELADFSKIPYVILDGAHTKNSILGATSTLEIYRKEKKTDKKPILLFACAKDKDVEAMAKILEPHFSKTILTSPGDFKTPDLPRAKKAFKNATLIEDHHEAIKTTLAIADQETTGLVVLGSFYLVAEVKKLFSE